MKGQWVGRYTDSATQGLILVDVDEVDDTYLGYAVLRPMDKKLSPTFAPFRTHDLTDNYSSEVDLLALNPNTYDPEPWESVKKFWPDSVHANKAKINVVQANDQLSINWETDLGVTGSCTLSRSGAELPSTYEAEPNIGDWNSFREHVRSIEPFRYMFRGQQNSLWRLRTSFHRTGRANLIRYFNQDMLTVQKYLSPRTRHNFNLNNPQEYGAFVGLIQHHGYPTPLLDWTHSPFVAAFFAYRGISNRDALAADPAAKVRIFMFSRTEWTSDQFQILKLAPLYPHFSIIDPLAIENPRMIPQQALSSITNIDDIESYLQFMEKDNKRYMRVFDLPVVERPKVIKELAVMGITAGSLLPGIDGACEELRERFFG